MTKITIDRAVVEQVLEAWDGDEIEWFKRSYTVMENLRTALAQGCYIAQDMTRQEYERLYPDAEEEVK